MRVQKKHRSGNPKWGRAIIEHVPVTLTCYEKLIMERGLVGETAIAADPEVREFVERRHNTRYVPEWLLREYGLEFSAAYGSLAI